MFQCPNSQPWMFLNCRVNLFYFDGQTIINELKLALKDSAIWLISLKTELKIMLAY